jgi:glycosyltransferase involved in cell wall biosynthesis
MNSRYEKNSPGVSNPINWLKTMENKKEKDYSVVIPAKNEGKHIINVLLSVVNQTRPPAFICVINDGSTDDTLNYINEFRNNYEYYTAWKIISLPKRKLSLVGTLTLGQIFNSGLILGGDTFLPHKYVEKLLKEFEVNKNLAITSGFTPEHVINKGHVEGSGRLIKSSFFKRIRYQYPEVTAWETSPLYLARLLDYDVYHTRRAKFYCYREATSNLKNYSYYGSGMRGLGYWTPYVIARAMLLLYHKKNLKRTIQMVAGYLSFKTVHSNKLLKIFVKDYQKKEIKRLLIGN